MDAEPATITFATGPDTIQSPGDIIFMPRSNTKMIWRHSFYPPSKSNGNCWFHTINAPNAIGRFFQRALFGIYWERL